MESGKINLFSKDNQFEFVEEQKVNVAATLQPLVDELWTSDGKPQTLEGHEKKRLSNKVIKHKSKELAFPAAGANNYHVNSIKEEKQKDFILPETLSNVQIKQEVEDTSAEYITDDVLGEQNQQYFHLEEQPAFVIIKQENGEIFEEHIYQQTLCEENQTCAPTFDVIKQEDSGTIVDVMDKNVYWENEETSIGRENATAVQETLYPCVESTENTLNTDNNLESHESNVSQNYIIKEEVQIEEQHFNVDQSQDDDVQSIASNKSDGCDQELAISSLWGSRKYDANFLDEFIQYICPKCGVFCDTYCKWKVHTETEHNFGTIDSLSIKTVFNEKSKPFHQCLDCLRQFQYTMTFSRLLQHCSYHMPYPRYIKCKVCKNLFNRKSTATSHILHLHPDLCRLESKKSNNTMEYIKITCTICFESQTTPKQYFYHMNNTHDYLSKCRARAVKVDKDLYDCNICHTKVREGWLRAHMLSHEPHKSYQCINCNKYASNRLSQAKNHVRRELLALRRRAEETNTANISKTEQTKKKKKA